MLLSRFSAFRFLLFGLGGSLGLCCYILRCGIIIFSNWNSLFGLFSLSLSFSFNALSLIITSSVLLISLSYCCSCSCYRSWANYALVNVGSSTAGRIFSSMSRLWRLILLSWSSMSLTMRTFYGILLSYICWLASPILSSSY